MKSSRTETCLGVSLILIKDTSRDRTMIRGRMREKALTASIIATVRLFASLCHLCEHESISPAASRKNSHAGIDRTRSIWFQTPADRDDAARPHTSWPPKFG